MEPFCIGFDSSVVQALFQSMVPCWLRRQTQLAKVCNLKDFTCSRSWIQRWHDRHGLVYGKVTGEAAAVDMEICDDWLKNVWPELRKEYSDDDIFNGDEAGLFYQLTPNKMYHFKEESCAGGKLSKEHITVFLAANMSRTEKRPLFIIGKSKKPRCFKNVKHLPVRYEANIKAWMTSILFQRMTKESLKSSPIG